MTPPQLTKYEILLLGGIVLVGLITGQAVIPLATTIFNQQQQSNNQAYPAPLPLIKRPVLYFLRIYWRLNKREVEK